MTRELVVWGKRSYSKKCAMCAKEVDFGFFSLPKFFYIFFVRLINSFLTLFKHIAHFLEKRVKNVQKNTDIAG